MNITLDLTPAEIAFLTYQIKNHSGFGSEHLDYKLTRAIERAESFVDDEPGSDDCNHSFRPIDEKFSMCICGKIISGTGKEYV